MNTSEVIFDKGLLPKVLHDSSFQDERKLIFYGFLTKYNSPHTIRNYKRELKVFFTYLNQFFPGLHEYQVEDVHALRIVNELKDIGASASKIRLHVAAMSSFYNYLFKKRKLKINPYDSIDRLPVPKEVFTKSLTTEALSQLLTYADSIMATQPRWAILIYIFFITGLRHTEITHMKKKDFTVRNGFVEFRVKQKGGKERVITLHKNITKSFLKYIEDQNLKDDDYVFAVRDKSKAPRDRPIAYIFTNCAIRAKIDCPDITPHVARATVVTFLLDQGVPIQEVSRYVGHESIQMTQLYNKKRLTVQRSIEFQDLIISH